MFDMQSPEIDKLAGALAKAQGAMQPAKFDKTMQGEKYSFRYATLASVHEAARLPLSGNGLAVVQTTTVEDGKLWLYTTLLHESGQYIRSIYPVIALQSVSPQVIGSALTYAKRYSFSAIVGIAGDEDDDGSMAGQGQTGSSRSNGGSNGNGRSNGVGGQQKGVPAAARDAVGHKKNGGAQQESVLEMVSAGTLAEIEQHGSAHYGALWQTKRVEIVDAITDGAAKGQLERMTVQEGAKMLNGIKIKIEAAALAAAQGRAA